MVKNKDVKKVEALVSKNKEVEDKKEEKKTFSFYKDCKCYAKISEREFHRRVGPINKEGKRSTIIEIRAG